MGSARRVAPLPEMLPKMWKIGISGSSWRGWQVLGPGADADAELPSRAPISSAAAAARAVSAFAAVANVAAQRPDGVGVAWIRQFQAEVRRALEPALDARAALVATAEGEDEMPAADEGASEDEGCEDVVRGYTYAPAPAVPLPLEAAARLQDASLATAANAAQRATSTVACLEELDRQSAGSVPHSSSFVDGSSGDDADAVCCHKVGGCCTVARPGAMLCESHAEEVFADMDDWRVAR